MKKDIGNRNDIELLVNTFYCRVIEDDLLGNIFTVAAPVHWEKHLSAMYSFWENALFFTGSYTGNPLEAHRRLNAVHPLTPAHFERWLDIFDATLNELFEGEKARLAGQRACSIAAVMQQHTLNTGSTQGSVY